MAKAPKNLAASVRQKLLSLARQEQKLFDVVLVAFGLEHLIYRLSVSPHKDKFVLKGGMLVTLWTKDQARFTRDVDFLSFGASDEDALIEIFKDTLDIDAGDGLIFDTADITAAQIREDQIYGGVRLKTVATLANAKIPITIDIGFGDSLTAPDFKIDYPSLLDFPDATIRAYSPATVMAEKFQALVALGLVNGRMKDFYDLWALPQSQEIAEAELAEAVRLTFARRNTPVPTDRPHGLSSAFFDEPAKQQQWNAYAQSIGLEGEPLAAVAEAIWAAFEPVCRAASQ